MSDNDTPDDLASDPVDKAYVQAEAVLGDEAARAARRARVLAAVEGERSTQPTPANAVPARRPVRRYGGWLAAACVAGLSVVVAIQVYPPAPRPVPPPAPVAPAPSAPPAAPGAAAIPAEETAGVSSDASQGPGKGPVAPGQAATHAAAAAPPPAPPSDELARRAFPASPAVVVPPPPPPAPAPSRDDLVVTAERASAAPLASGAGYASRGAMADKQDIARPSAGLSPADAAGLAAPALDRGARLRAAAATGRTAEVTALLDQGAAVDAPDADGDTALMKSIRAGHSAVAAILRRHGASLDRRNHAGESARDMAAARADTALNRAIGLDP